MKKLMLKILATVMAVVCVFGLTACNNNDNKDPVSESKGTIAVCAKGESHAFWQAVKKGAQDAGAKYGYDVTFAGPVDETSASIPQQQEQITAALGNKNLKGMVIATIGTGYVDQLTECKTKGLPVVQFDSGIWKDDLDALNAAGKNPIVAHVATSNVLAAALAAEEFYKVEKEAIDAATQAEPYIIGVIQHDESSTGVDRAKGFMDKMTELAGNKVKLEKEIAAGDKAGAYTTCLDNLKTKNVKAVFMCNEGVVKEVADAIVDGGYVGIKFVGFDAGTKQSDWIKNDQAKSTLVGSVAQDSYSIGYKAVEQCVNAIEGKTVTDVAIAGRWYTKANIDQLIADNIVYQG